MNASSEEYRAAVRVHFFDGQLLTAQDFQAEQQYHMEKRRLHNRILHGTGVVSGLEVGAVDGSTVQVEPGLALDLFGREIVVPEAHRVDAAQPTDDEGEPQGPRRDDGHVTLRLSYREEPVEPGRTMETYRLLVRSGDPRRRDRDVVLATIRLRGGRAEVEPSAYRARAR